MRIKFEQGGNFSTAPQNAVLTVETREGHREKLAEFEPHIAIALAREIRKVYGE